MPKFRITHPRYVQQVGEFEPHYVYADPENPAVINIPDDPAHEHDRGLKRIAAADEGPEPLRPPYAKVKRGPEVQTSVERQIAKGKTVPSKERASDEQV